MLNRSTIRVAVEHVAPPVVNAPTAGLAHVGQSHDIHTWHHLLVHPTKQAPTMRLRRVVTTMIGAGFSLLAPTATALQPSSPRMVRIAEIDVEPRYLSEYLAILRTEAAASVRLEPGVICIFPMAEQAEPTRIRLLEIYASREAYEAHLRSPHFLEYKSSTAAMIRSLRLVDMSALDASAVPAIFRKGL